MSIGQTFEVQSGGTLSGEAYLNNWHHVEFPTCNPPGEMKETLPVTDLQTFKNRWEL